MSKSKSRKGTHQPRRYNEFAVALESKAFRQQKLNSKKVYKRKGRNDQQEEMI